MERFRQAESAAKPALVAALRAVECTASDVCEAKKVCLSSAEPTAQALRLKSEVEQGLHALTLDASVREAAQIQALPAKLDEAEHLLQEGYGALPRCTDALTALKRKYAF